MSEYDEQPFAPVVDINDGPKDLKPRADYFGASKPVTVMLPDGVSFIQHTKLNEGGKRAYLNAVNRDIRISQRTQEAHLKLAPGDDRAHLLKAAITGWDLYLDGAPLAFNPHGLKRVLEEFPPEVLDEVEKSVREVNTWLTSDISLEAIDEQIAQLTDLRAKREAEEEGKGSSAN